MRCCQADGQVINCVDHCISRILSTLEGAKIANSNPSRCCKIASWWATRPSCNAVMAYGAPQLNFKKHPRALVVCAGAHLSWCDV